MRGTGCLSHHSRDSQINLSLSLSLVYTVPFARHERVSLQWWSGSSCSRFTAGDFLRGSLKDLRKMKLETRWDKGNFGTATIHWYDSDTPTNWFTACSGDFFELWAWPVLPVTTGSWLWTFGMITPISLRAEHIWNPWIDSKRLKAIGAQAEILRGVCSSWATYETVTFQKQCWTRECRIKAMKWCLSAQSVKKDGKGLGTTCGYPCEFVLCRWMQRGCVEWLDRFLASRLTLDTVLRKPRKQVDKPLQTLAWVWDGFQGFAADTSSSGLFQQLQTLQGLPPLTEIALAASSQHVS